MQVGNVLGEEGVGLEPVGCPARLANIATGQEDEQPTRIADTFGRQIVRERDDEPETAGWRGLRLVGSHGAQGE
jgi:hypothetical protein